MRSIFNDIPSTVKGKNIAAWNYLCITIIGVGLLIFPAFTIHASTGETLPSWHWAYEFVNELRLRGAFTGLCELNRPYTRGEVAGELIALRRNVDAGKLFLSMSDLRLVDMLEKEFHGELEALSGKTPKGDRAEAGAHILGDLNRPENGKAKYDGIYRSRIGVSLGSHVTLFNGNTIDQYQVENPDYVGKKWRSVVGFVEQGYVSIHKKRFRFKFGRDFLRWGPGEDGTLLFSGAGRPLDQLTVAADLGPFRYTFLASVLDDLPVAQPAEGIPDGTVARRYVSAHRLDAGFFQGRLQCAVSEAVIYGGIDRQMEWVYLNPFLFFHAEQLNDGRQGNTMGTVDIAGYPARRWKVYGSLLVDDIQVEKKSPGDLEPGEIGWIAGTRWADPFNLSGFTVSVEYARVTNRTYKTLNDWERFVHRNVPLGHPLGNDFDHIRLDVSKWMFGNVRIDLGYSRTRDGEGSLFTPFDSPWINYTVEEGYSEPFPTGVVEKQSTFRLSLRWYPSTIWGLEADIHSIHRKNANHCAGEEESLVFWRIGFWLDGEVSLLF